MARLAGQRADTLSGGQQQRVAIARALVQEPDIILADEPIASLDPRNTKVVMDALLHINQHFGITVICNLHSLDLARSYCDRLVGMAAGRVVFDGVPAALTDAVARDLYGLEAGEVDGPRLPAPASLPEAPRPGLAARRFLIPSTPSSTRRTRMLTRRLALGAATRRLVALAGAAERAELEVRLSRAGVGRDAGRERLGRHRALCARSSSTCPRSSAPR